jgi:hypothetical protein
LKIYKFIPNFFIGFEIEEDEFNNTEELVAIEWVKEYTNFDDFYRFSIDRDKHGNPHDFMVEFKNGSEWWAVAKIENGDISGIDDIPDFLGDEESE